MNGVLWFLICCGVGCVYSLVLPPALVGARMWFVGLLVVALIMSLPSLANASPLPAPMRDAVDSYAQEYGTYEGWDYVDRVNGRGDYRRAYFKLEYIVPQSNPNAEVNMEVDARVARCGPGWYVVSTPLDPNVCEVNPWSLHW